jgi:C-terminal processing protease CtpA/Prc
VSGQVFDEAALVAAGVSPDSARQTRERWEENVLDRLYLNDRAAREGWTDSQRHWRELTLLDEQLRAKLSDDEYDEYLFASGAANRVVVRDVTSGSAGAEIGLLPGDVIVRYDGQRVFATEDLQQATWGGSPGEPVSLEVHRDGGSIRMTVPRGAFVTDETRPPSADLGRR